MIRWCKTRTSSQNSRKSFRDVHSAKIVARLVSAQEAIAGQRAMEETMKAITPTVLPASSAFRVHQPSLFLCDSSQLVVRRVDEGYDGRGRGETASWLVLGPFVANAAGAACRTRPAPNGVAPGGAANSGGFGARLIFDPQTPT